MNYVTSTFVNTHNPSSFSTYLRRKRSERLRKMVARAIDKKGSCRIIDLGGTKDYWNKLGWTTGMHAYLSITIVNNIDRQEQKDDIFQFIISDATNLKEVSDCEYDICHSNSVIEHLETWERKKRFAKETARIAKTYFVQTPNFWFPIEPHFFTPAFHWLPKPWRIALTSSFNLGWHPRASTLDDAMKAVEDANLLTWRMMRHLFPDAILYCERFAFLTKSFIAIRE